MGTGTQGSKYRYTFKLFTIYFGPCLDSPQFKSWIKDPDPVFFSSLARLDYSESAPLQIFSKISF